MKLRFLAGIAAGYVLGTRAGREQYDRLVQALNDSELLQTARDELSKLRGSSASTSSAATGEPLMDDVVLPDLEPSTSASDFGDAGKPTRATRVNPPATP